MSTNGKYKPGTLKLAQGRGWNVADLLWKKILNEATPAQREMLMTFMGLQRACECIAPQPEDHWGGDDETLRKKLRAAEKILVGDDSWFDDYMRRPILARSDIASPDDSGRESKARHGGG